jgi:hypothetical protein
MFFWPDSVPDGFLETLLVGLLLWWVVGVTLGVIACVRKGQGKDTYPTMNLAVVNGIMNILLLAGISWLLADSLVIVFAGLLWCLPLWLAIVCMLIRPAIDIGKDTMAQGAPD